MSASDILGRAPIPASYILGDKLDSIPFSAHHMVVILVLGTVGFVEGYDVALSGSLLVLAKEPLQLAGEQIRWLAVAPILFLVVGAFTASAPGRRSSWELDSASYLVDCGGLG
jgi:hypothetical protein